MKQISLLIKLADMNVCLLTKQEIFKVLKFLILIMVLSHQLLK